LGKLVRQCEQVYRHFFGEDRVIFNPDVFRFKEGVRSNSNDHLGREERFANISSHLEFGPNADLHNQDTVIVFDDVVTSGSSLIGAKKLLREHPVGSIQLLALAKNIGNIMPDKWANEALYDPDK
jgi:hypothetical protein